MITYTAYISLGTNLGDRIENLRKSVALLGAEKNIELLNTSSVYETDPVGGPEQGSFLNACIKISTVLSPEELLSKMLAIEDKLGRIREERWGPRLIDLDLLAYEEQTIDTEFLQLPHPRMEERDFVMVPLNDIAPCLIFPGLDKSVSEILANRKVGSDIKLYAPAGWQTN